MVSTRIQFFILAAVLAVAAGGLFIPEPGRDGDRPFTILAATGAEKLAADLAAETAGGSTRSVVVETGSGPTLARQMARGLTPDVIIASGDREIERLAAAGKIHADRVVLLMEAPLVVVVREDRPAPAHEAEYLLSPTVRFIAVGSADTELGRTTESALKTLGLWFKLLPHFQPCRTPEIALNRVRRGLADAAIVFGPTAAAGSQVRVLRKAFSPNSYTPVRYQAVLARNARNPEAGRRFLAFLDTDDARRRIDAFREGTRQPIERGRWARIMRPLLLSLRATCLAVMVVFPLALLVAAYLARRRASALRKGLEALVDLPLVLPPVAVGCVMLLLLSKGGLVFQATGLPLAFTWQAAAIAAGVMCFPLAVRPMRRAFEAVDPRYLKAATTLGGSSFSNFLVVTLPLSWRGVAAGLVLAFARAFGEFGATLVVAGNIPHLTRTLPQALFTEMESGDSATAIILLLVAVVAAYAATLGAALIGPERKQP